MNYLGSNLSQIMIMKPRPDHEIIC